MKFEFVDQNERKYEFEFHNNYDSSYIKYEAFFYKKNTIKWEDIFISHSGLKSYSLDPHLKDTCDKLIKKKFFW